MDNPNRKITVNLALGLHPIIVTSRGVEFNDTFRERLIEQEKYFRDNIVSKINDAIGDNWAVSFTEVPVDHKSFLVDIQATENNHFQIIMNIIHRAFSDTEFSFWKPGPPSTHLGTVKSIE